LIIAKHDGSCIQTIPTYK